MVTSMQILGAVDPTPYRVYHNAWHSTDRFAGGLSGPMNFEDARAYYLNVSSTVDQIQVGPNGELPYRTYVVFYKVVGDTIKFVAARGVPTEGTPAKVSISDIPETPPTTEPDESQLVTKDPRSSKSFWARYKWFVIGGAATVAVGGIASVITLKRKG